MVTMEKDLFRRHTPKRHAGFIAPVARFDGLRIDLMHKSPECGDLSVTFDCGRFGRKLFDVRVSFCLACGRFLGFGTRYELCWICESELEPEEFEEELEMSI